MRDSRLVFLIFTKSSTSLKLFVFSSRRIKMSESPERSSERISQKRGKVALSTSSPTDANVSPVSKTLLGLPRKRSSHSQVLKEVIMNDRKKRQRNSASAASSTSRAAILNAIVEKQKERIKKSILVPVSPNIPRKVQPKKTPKASQTPRMEHPIEQDLNCADENA